MRFLDTNILLYSVSSAQNERAKRETAERLLLERDNALSVQVLQEFYAQATRPTRAARLTHETAVRLIGTWLRFPVQSITVAVMSDALDIKAASRPFLLGRRDRCCREGARMPGIAVRGHVARPRHRRREDRQSVSLTANEKGRPVGRP